MQLKHALLPAALAAALAAPTFANARIEPVPGITTTPKLDCRTAAPNDFLQLQSPEFELTARQVLDEMREALQPSDIRSFTDPNDHDGKHFNTRFAEEFRARMATRGRQYEMLARLSLQQLGSCLPGYLDLWKDFLPLVYAQLNGRDVTGDLYDAYKAYIIVKRCHDMRRGYLAVWISDAEMQQAKETMHLLEERAALSRDAADALWARADQRVQAEFGTMLSIVRTNFSDGLGLCQRFMGQLRHTQRKLFPDSVRTRKDF